MAKREILVVGGTGRLGGLVAHELAARGHAPRCLVRDPARAQGALPAGARLVVGDLADPASLEPAVADVDALLVVSSLHPQQRALQGNLVRAAAKGGQPLVVKISGLGTAPDSFVDSGRWHAETELDVRELGLPFTFLWPYYLMQNLAMQLPGARADGVYRAGAPDARIAMVDAEDVAAVAACLLAGEVERRDEAIDLTGPEALTHAQVAERIGVALGREVRHEPLPGEAARALFERIGMPDWHVEILLQFERAFAAGFGETVNDAVLRVLGRPPRSLSDYLAEKLGPGGGP